MHDKISPRYKLVLGLGLLLASAPAIAADPPAQATTGKSQMSVGFTPPEKPASGPKPWTDRDAYYARQYHQKQENPQLPRCEQDRLLTDTKPCDPNAR